MSVIGDLRTGLKANLDAIAGWNVSKYALSNPMGGPVIHLWPTTVTYHKAMTLGVQEVEFTVQAVVAVTTDQDPQAKLDSLLGDENLVDAIEADKTLGGAADTLWVSQAANVQISVTATNETRLTADWSVTVLI